MIDNDCVKVVRSRDKTEGLNLRPGAFNQMSLPDRELNEDGICTSADIHSVDKC
jgi:hypothetical protein